MDDALAMCMGDRPSDLLCVSEGAVDLQTAAAGDDGLQRLTRHVLHDDEEDIILLLGGRDRDDVRVIKAGKQAGFAQQLAEVQVLPVGDLERDLLVEPGVFGEIDRTEATAA